MFTSDIGKMPVISDKNYKDFLDPVVDGQKVGRGLIPRDYNTHPVGSIPRAVKFNLPIMSRQEMKERIKDRAATGNTIPRYCDKNGVKIKNQKNTNFCWMYATVKCVEIMRVMARMPYVELSATSCAARIKNYANVGGWGYEAINYLTKYGCDPASIWPDDLGTAGINRKYDTEQSRKEREKYKVNEFWELQRNNFDQLVTCVLLNIPVSIGLDWWGHQVAVVDAVILKNGGLGVVIDNSWGCYSDDTEVLTDSGWKLFKDTNALDKFATLNPATHHIEYQYSDKYHEYDYNGDMYHYNSRDIDLLVTPNHNMYVNKLNDNKNNISSWQKIRADKMSKHVRMKKNGIWNGKEISKIKIADKEISMDDWLEFLGYFISEGSTHSSVCHRKERVRVRKGKNSYYTTIEKARMETSYVVTISQKKTENLEKIQRLLNKLPFKFKKTPGGWSTNNKKLYNILKDLGKSHQKYIPDFVWSLSARQLKILYDSLMLGDGSLSVGSTGTKRTYYTSSKRLADDFQKLCLYIGYAGDISKTDRIGRDNGTGGITRHIEYRIGIKIKEVTPSCRKGFVPKYIKYDGKVYCVTVPNGTLFVRRNGKACWCGNSNWGDKGRGILEENRARGDMFAPRVVRS